MTDTTTVVDRVARERRRRQIVLLGVSLGGWVLALSVLLHVAGLGVLWKADFLSTRIVFDPEEEAERTAEVEKREAERKAAEERERAEKELPDEHRDKLKREAEARAERRLVEKVREIAQTRERVEEIKDRKLAQVEQRPEEAYRRSVVEELVERAERLRREADELQKRVPAGAANQAASGAQRTERKAKEYARELGERLAAAPPEAERFEGAPERLPESGAEAAGGEPPDAREASGPESARAEAEAADRDAERTAGELAELAKATAESARLAAESSPGEHRRRAEGVAREAEALAAEAERLAGGAPLDAGEFNDTSEARAREPEVPAEELAALESKAAEELYELAERLERDVTQAYADARAAELAMVQNTSFAEAQEKLNVSAPERPDIGERLASQPIGTVAELNAYRETLGQAVQEAESMRLATQNQLAQAEGIDPGAAAAGNAEYARMMAMRAGASTGQGQRGLDLSSLMRAAVASTGGSAGSGDSVVYANSNLEAGGVYRDAEKLPELRLNKNEIAAQALPGRRFDRESSRKGWLYIDTWYIIGPFETSGDVRHRAVFPPEYEINFDAVYEGKKQKDGEPRQLQWQFTQSDMIRVTPPDEQSNSAYYAFTELYFEDDTDMLLAIASDDAAKVWINEMLVWEDKDLSPWNIGEGFRKVFFRRGFNKVLVRIDNGPVVCQFSVLICPPEALASR